MNTEQKEKIQFKVEEYNEYIVIALEDTFDCCIDGTGDVEEGINIMESIEIY